MRIQSTLVLALLSLWILAPAGTTLAGPDIGTLSVADKDHLQFATSDGVTQNIRIDDIWRIRLTFAEGEPSGRTVVDYAFTRLFVKNSINDVVEQIRRTRPVAKFTAPNGSDTYLIVGRIVDVQAALRHQHHPDSKAIISTREGQQQVRENKARVLEIIGQNE